jgi:hypothetical protein
MTTSNNAGGRIYGREEQLGIGAILAYNKKLQRTSIGSEGRWHPSHNVSVVGLFV